MKRLRALKFTAAFFVCLFSFVSIAAFAITGTLQNNVAFESVEANEGIAYDASTKTLTIGAGIYNASTIKSQGVDAHPDLVSVVFTGYTTINGDTEYGQLFRRAGSLTNFTTNGTITLNGTAGVGMFQHCTTLTKLDLHDLDTSNATALWTFFDGCFALQEVNVSSFNTSKCSGIYGLTTFFKDCRALKEVDVSSFDITQTTSLISFFQNCYALTTIKGIENWDITGKDVTDMFNGCTSLSSIDCDTFRLTAAMGLPNPASGTYWFPTNASKASGLSTAADLINYTTAEDLRAKYGTAWFRAASDPHVVGDYYVTGDLSQVSLTNSRLQIAGGTVVVSMLEGKTTSAQPISIIGDSTVTLNNVSVVTSAGVSSLAVSSEYTNVTFIIPDGTVNTISNSGQVAALAYYGSSEKTVTFDGGPLGTGKLIVKGGNGSPAMGVSRVENTPAKAVINGGVFELQGGSGAPAIVNGITINGGTVTAVGGSSAAGIGGFQGQAGKDIALKGGIITATGGNGTSAIGGGVNSGASSNIEINGDVVCMATGGSGSQTALASATKYVRGICFQRLYGKAWSSDVYGGNVTIPSDVTFPANLTIGDSAEESITVPKQVAVTLPSGVTLTNGLYGTVNIETDDEDPENNGSVIGAGSLATKVSYRTADGTTPPADATFTYSTNGEVQTYGTTLATLSDPLFLCWYAEEDFSGTGLDATQPVVLNAHTLWERTGYPFEVSGGSEDDYAFDETNQVLSINTDTNLEIANTVSNVSTAWRIEVAASAPGANVTLNGVNIVTNTGAPFFIPLNYANDVHITLGTGTKNILKATTDKYAALQKGDTNGSNVGTLTIEGEGELDATAGKYAAAIGGAGEGQNGSHITINSGTIYATAPWKGAGIGGSSPSDEQENGAGRYITITGGKVIATGGTEAAGIGGGHKRAGDYISITGGVVEATGGVYNTVGAGAAIGGGSPSSYTCSNNIINGNVVVIATSGAANRAALDGFTFSPTTPGILFSRLGSTGSWGSTMYGSVEITEDVTFPTNLAFGTQDEQTLSVQEGTVLTLPSDYYIQVNKFGSITLEQDQDNPENNGKIDCLGRILTAVWFETGGVKPTTSTNLLYMSNNEVQQYGTYLPNMDGTDFLGWYPDEGFSENPINAASDVLLNTHTLYGRFGVPFNIQGGKPDSDYSFDTTNKVLNINTAEALEISNVVPINATSWRIAIASTANGANITLNGVNITATNGAAFIIPNGASFDVQILLKDGSKNILQGKAGGNGVPGSPGIQKRNEGTGWLIIGVPEGSAGTGELDVIGGHATAGIGGDYQMNGGNIRINAGVVNATGGNGGAAIGGGSWANVSGRSQGNNITINGGTVTARAGYAAAAIGGGWTGSGNNITIAGGTVYAYGGVPTPPDGTEGSSAIGSGFEAKDVASGNTVNGNAIIYATSGSAGRTALDGFSDTGLSQGIVFSRQGEAGIWAGALYGSVELSQDVTFPANLSVGAEDAEQTLTIPEGVTLNLGTTTLYNGANGTITLNGEILGGKVTTAVSYVTRDGITPPSSTVFTYSENGVVKTYGTLPSIVDEEFYGWFTTDTFEGDRLASTSPVELNAHTLYAKFEEIPFVITGGTEGTDYTYTTVSRVLEIKTNTALKIANKDQETATAARIVINDTVSESTISLAGVNIATSTGPAITVNTNGNITFLLVDDSVNTIRTSIQFEAGLHKNGAGKLTIQGGSSGSGSLTVTGGNQGAGIGSRNNQSVSNIAITGGVVTANGGGFAAGIGGGNGGRATNILISGGNVTAKGGYRAAGIGGGYQGTESGITITGGIVVANGGALASGIGGGDRGSGSNNKLDGDAVLVANSIQGFDEASGGNLTKGIAFVGNKGTMYSDVTLPGNVSFPASLTIGDIQNTPQALTVPSGVVLTIPEGIALTNAKFGTIEIAEGATLDCKGTISTRVTFDTKGAGEATPTGKAYTYMQNNTQKTYGELATVGEVPIEGWYSTEEPSEASKVTTTDVVELNTHTLFANYDDTAWMNYASNTLTLSYGQKPEGTINETVWHLDSTYTETSRPGWYTAQGENIETFSVAESAKDFVPTSTAWWFAGLSSLETFTGLDELDWSLLENTTSMFSGCTSLASLSLPTDFTLSKVSGTNGQNMFSGLSALTSLTLPKNFVFPESSGFDFGSSTRFWRASISEQMDYSDSAEEAWKTYLQNIETATHTFTIATVDLTFLAGEGAHFTDDESIVELHLYGNADEAITEAEVPVGILEGSVFKGYTTPGSTEVIPTDEITAFPATNTTYTASYVLIPFVVTGGVEGEDFSFDTDTFTLEIKTSAKELSIANISSVTQVKNWQIKASRAAKLVLAGINMTTETRSPLLLSGGFTSSIKLLAGTSNVLIATTAGCAGLQKDQSGGMLTISSTGEGTPGSLTASGGEAAPGIGAAFNNTQNITIESGNITATGGTGAAGIGSAPEKSALDIFVTGGNVSATGGEGAAGIGSGVQSSESEPSASRISLTGGVITALAGETKDGKAGAGVGAGAGGSATENKLAGNCVVYATSGAETKEALEGFSASTGLLQGIAFTQKGSAAKVGTMYGSVTLPQSVNFSASIAFGNDAEAPQTFTIPENTTLTVVAGTTLTNGLYGTIVEKQGSTLIADGTVQTAVSFDTQGITTEAIPNKTLVYKKDGEACLYGELPEVPGFTVEGWFSDEALTTEVRAEDEVSLNTHTLYAKVSDTLWMSYNKKALTLSYGQMPENTVIEESAWHLDEAGYTTQAPWSIKHNQDIETFVVDQTVPATFKPTTMAYWFYNLSKLTTVSNLDHLNTEALANTTSMFASCTSLAELELPNSFSILQDGDAASMFESCTSLKTLSLGESFVLSVSAETQNMFSGCTALETLTLPKNFTFGTSSGFAFGSDTSFWISSVTHQMPYGEGEAAAWNAELSSISEATLTVTRASVVLTFDAEGGAFADDSDTFEIYGNADEAIEEDVIQKPSKEAYDFSGYALTSDGSTDATPTVFPASSTTYYAIWTQAAYMKVTGDTLSLTYGACPEGTLDENVFKVEDTYTSEPAWTSAAKDTATTFIVDDSVKVGYKPTSVAWWLSGLSKLTSVSGLDKLDLSELSDASSFVSGCSSLTSLSLPAGFANAALTTTNLFANTPALETLTLPKGFVMAADAGLSFGSDTRFWTASVTRQMDFESASAAATDWTSYLAALTEDTHTFTIATITLTFSANGGSFAGGALESYLYGQPGASIASTDIPVPTYSNYDFDGYGLSVDATQTVTISQFPTSTPAEPYWAMWSQSAYMKLSQDTLTLSYGACPEGTLDTDVWKVKRSYTDTEKPGWTAAAANVTTFSVAGTQASLASYKPESMAWWLSGLSHLTSIEGLDKLDLSALRDTAHLFDGCSSIKAISLPAGMKPATQADMFSGCSLLESLTLPKGFVMASDSGLSFGSDNSFWIASIERKMDYSSKEDAASDWTSYLASIEDATHTFTIAHITLTFDAGQGQFGESSTQTQTYLYGNATEEIAEGTIKIPTRENYDFSGYALTEGGSTDATPTVFPATSTIYYAIWTQSAYMKLSENTLTLSFGACPEGTLNQDVWKVQDAYTQSPEWAAHADAITTFAVTEALLSSYKPTSVAWWFAGLSKLDNVSALTKLDLSEATDANHMFSGCSALTSLSLPANFKPTVTDAMFEGTTSLSTVSLGKGFSFGDATGFNFIQQSPFWIASMQYKMSVISEETARADWNSYLTNIQTATHTFTQASRTITFNANGGSFGPDKTTSFLYGNAGTAIPGAAIPEARREGATSKVYTDSPQGTIACTPTVFKDKNEIFYALWGQDAWMKYESTDNSLTLIFGVQPEGDIDVNVWKVKDTYTDTPEWSTLYGTLIQNVVIDDSVSSGHYLPTSTAYWFKGLSALLEIENLKDLNTSSVNDVTSMFEGCSSLSTVDVSHFDVDSVLSFAHLFEGCASLTSLDLSTFDTSSATSFEAMCKGVGASTITLSSLFTSASVTNMNSMFSGCAAITSLDLSALTVGASTSMQNMFEGCSALNAITLSSAFSFKADAGFSFTDASPFWIASINKKMVNTTVDAAVTDWNSYLASLSAEKPTHTFTKARVTLTFNAGAGQFGDTVPVQKESYLYGNADEAIDPKDIPCPTRTDYDFSGYADSEAGTTDVTPDTFPAVTPASSYWAIWTQSAYMKLSGDTLTLSYGACPEGTLDTDTWKVEPHYTQAPGWAVKAALITSFALDETAIAAYKPESVAYWFYNLQKLTEVSDFAKLDLSAATDATSLFEGSSALSEITLPTGFAPQNTTNMFGTTSALATITLPQNFVFGDATGFSFGPTTSGFWIADASKKMEQTTEAISDWNAYLAALEPRTTHTFKRADVTLTFNAGDGHFKDSASEKTAYLYGRAGDALSFEMVPKPVQADYNFIGYGLTADATVSIVFSAFPASDTNYFALYGKGAYMKYASGTLTLSYGTKPQAGVGEGVWEVSASYTERTPWATAYGDAITEVVVDASAKAYAPSSMAWWFSGLTNLTAFENWNNLNTSALTNVGHLFEGCASLEALTLPDSFTVASSGDFSALLSGCTSLATLTLPTGVSPNASATTEAMFAQTSALTKITLPKNFTFGPNTGFGFGTSSSFWISSIHNQMAYSDSPYTSWTSFLQNIEGASQTFTKASVVITLDAAAGHFGVDSATKASYLYGVAGQTIDTEDVYTPTLEGAQFLYYTDATGTKVTISVFPSQNTTYTARYETIPFVVSGGVENTDYVFDGANQVLQILTNTPLTISNKSDIDISSWAIEVAHSNDSLTFTNVHCAVSRRPALLITESANVKLILGAASENSFVAKDAGYAGIQKEGSTNTLEIFSADTINPGFVSATGGIGASGIGGARGKSASYISFTGASVSATGGAGASGIGGGAGGSGSYIAINSGNVAAQGETGIGGGHGASGSHISLLGGFVTAEGGLPEASAAGAGIGGGAGDSASAFNVLNGNCVVNATSGASSKDALEGFGTSGLTKGIAFTQKGAQGNVVGAMYGSSVALDKDVEFRGNLTIGENEAQTLSVAKSATLTLALDTILTNGLEGSIELEADPQDPSKVAKVIGRVDTVVSYSVKEGATQPEDAIFTYQSQAGARGLYTGLATMSDTGFSGWYKTTSYAASDKVTPLSLVDLNLHTLYARFMYEVSYVVPEGTFTPPATETVDDGSTLASPSVTWDSGTIEGWYTTDTFDPASKWIFAGTTETTPSTVEGTTTLYAKLMCTVSFDSAGAGDIADQTLVYGSKITNIPAPTKEGKYLLGWYYTDQSQKEVQWKFTSDCVKKNITLTAKWGDKFVVSFVVPEGTVTTPDEQEIVPGECAEEPSISWDKGTFEGWYSDSNFSEDSKWNFSVPVSENMELYGKFSCAVSFNSDGGSAVATQHVLFNTAATKPNAPTKPGFSFVAWYAADSLAAYSFETPVTEDITLTATWQGPLSVYVPSQPQNGTITLEQTSALPGTVVYFSSVPNTHYVRQGLPKVTRVGDAQDAVTVTAINNTRYSFVMPYFDVNVSAEFRGEECTLSFDTQGGDAVASQTVEYGTFALDPGVTPKREGYSFDNWYTEASGGSIWKFSENRVYGDTTVYAHWLGDLHTVEVLDTPDAKGTVTIETPVDNRRTGEKIVLAVRPDAGWEVDTVVVRGKTSGDEVAVSRDSGENRFSFVLPNEDVEVSVTYKQQVLTVHFNLNNGEDPITQEVAYGELLVRPEDPARSGYHFVTWLKEDGSAYDFQNPVTESFTLSAAWEGNAHSLTVPSDLSGGTALVAPSSPRTGDTVVITLTPDAGYKINGTPSVIDQAGNIIELHPTDTPGVFTFVMPDADLTLRASFVTEDQSESGWQYDGEGGWWYELPDGEYYEGGWQWIDDTYGAYWYYFKGDGYMEEDSWIWDSARSSWYYVSDSGAMLKGVWSWIGSAWYGFNWDGTMCQGWTWDADYVAWYYCEESGKMLQDHWYYEQSTNEWFFFLDSGKMATNAWVDRGWYYVNWRGLWVWE